MLKKLKTLVRTRGVLEVVVWYSDRWNLNVVLTGNVELHGHGPSLEKAYKMVVEQIETEDVCTA